MPIVVAMPSVSTSHHEQHHQRAGQEDEVREDSQQVGCVFREEEQSPMAVAAETGGPFTRALALAAQEHVVALCAAEDPNYRPVEGNGSRSGLKE